MCLRHTRVHVGHTGGTFIQGAFEGQDEPCMATYWCPKCGAVKVRSKAWKLPRALTGGSSGVNTPTLFEKLKQAATDARLDHDYKSSSIAFLTDDGERVRIRFEDDDHNTLEGVYVLPTE